MAIVNHSWSLGFKLSLRRYITSRGTEHQNDHFYGMQGVGANTSVVTLPCVSNGYDVSDVPILA